MGNNHPLTETEYHAFQPHPLLIQHIEDCRSNFAAAKEKFSILDWGCGKGKLVLWLRERGYNAYGVDIAHKHFEKSAELFRSKGFSVQKCLNGLDANGRAPFADLSFHFITSWQTVEHVRDLEVVAAEWMRLTVHGGRGLHIYPSHRKLVEPHLFMPCIHWLPKKALRKWLIGFFVFINVEPYWWPKNFLSLKERACAYYEFSVNETFYRAPGAIRACLEEKGFETEFVDLFQGSELTAKTFLSALSKRRRAWYTKYRGDLWLATCLNLPRSNSACVDAQPLPTSIKLDG